MTGPHPQLYWISGSPPAWRVMLALTLKGIAFESRQLDHGAGENHAPEYLKLNPKGQVPTLVMGDLVIRESIAILGWLDRAVAERPIWGATTEDAAQVWQDVMEMEAVLRAPVTDSSAFLEALSDCKCRGPFGGGYSVLSLTLLLPVCSSIRLDFIRL